MATATTAADRRRVTGPDSVAPLPWHEVQKPAVLSGDKTRLDQRGLDQHRPIYLRRGIVTQANGSAYIEAGRTKIVCAVYGPRQMKRQQMITVDRARVHCEFKYVTFATPVRRGHVRDQQEKEYSQIMAQTLSSVIRLDLYGKSTIDVYVNVLECDGVESAMAMAMVAASVACADGGIEMLDLVSACAIGLRDGTVMMDMTEAEASDGKVSGGMVVARTGSLGEIAHVHHTGRVSREVVEVGLEKAMEVCAKIHSVMVQALLA